MSKVIRQRDRLAAVEAPPAMSLKDRGPTVSSPPSSRVGLISLPAMSRAEHHARRHMLRAAGEGAALENHGLWSDGPSNQDARSS